MKKNSEILLVREVAIGLGDLASQVVFVGGATTALYINDEQAPNPTTTDDVDLIIEITSLSQYEALEKKLRKLGFKRDLSDPGSICRFKYKEIDVDIMPTEEAILGFTNSFYAEGIQHAMRVDAAGESVRIFSVPFFFASKLEAFSSRRKGDDLRVSRDLEDLFAVLDGRNDLIDEFNSATSHARKYIHKSFQELLQDGDLLLETAKGFLANYGEPTTTARAIKTITLIRQIVDRTKTEE